jgi:putative aldouronate transport system substrate-binding protein
MRRKIFLLLTALVLGITGLIFAGCKRQSEPSSDRVDPDTEITSLISADTLPNANNSIVPELRRKTGVNFRPVFVPPVDYNTRLNAMIASGDLPDIVNYPLTVGVDLVKYSALKELSSLLNEYGKNILADRDGMLSYGINDKDHIYGIPQSPWYPFAVGIRRDWMQNTGLKPPEGNIIQLKMSDFLEIMRAFTNKDPDKDGKKDTFGLCFTIKAIGMIAPIFNAFNVPMQGTNSGGAPGWYVDLEGKLRYYLKHPNFLKAMEVMRAMYQEGLIDTDFLTVPDSISEFGNLFNGTAGAVAWAPAGTTNNWLGRYVEKLKATDFFYAELTADDGSGGGSYLPPSTNFFGIASSCKYPEGAMKLLDYINTEEGDILTYFGIEGKHFKWIDRNAYKVEYLPPYTDAVIHRGDGCWNIEQRFRSIRTNAELNSLTPITQEIIGYMRDRTVKDSVYLFTEPAIKSQIGTTLDDIELELFANLIVSKGDLQPQYLQLIAKWEAAGGKTYEEQADAIYRAQME